MINGQYTPLNLNCLGQLLNDVGLCINPTQVTLMGVSTSNSTYATRGTVYTETPLNKLADVTSLAYSKIGSASSTTITQSTYNALINMGSASIPALGNSKPAEFTNTYSGAMTKYGWLRLIAYQAHQEFYINSGSYSDFVNTFITCDGYLHTTNRLIKNYSVAGTYLKTTYSNMNDLMTSDITGVSLATLYWGQDLIASGRAINLKRINDFGLPSVLLKTLMDNNALAQSGLKVALVAAAEKFPDIFVLNNVINDVTNNRPLTSQQEQVLYAVFTAVMLNDLAEICILLNCQTAGLNTLADLLDPKKIFPNSYQTLTFPKYNIDNKVPTNSKTYYPIYVGGMADTGLTPTIGLRLSNIMPLTIACACDAFSIAMMQISNIQSMNIEKFAQVVTNMENVSGINTGTATYPINPDIAVTATDTLSKGSGTDNTYTTCDFFGAMTNLHYDFVTLKGWIQGLNTTQLNAIYDDMYALLIGGGPYEATLLTYISDANDEIANILADNPVLANKLNTVYSTFGTYLQKEQDARSQALPNIADLSTSNQDIYSFMQTLNEFAVQTQDNGPALVLESIADTTTMGGNSLIGSMRETRNSERLGLAGGRLDSGVDNTPFILPRVTGDTAANSPIPGYTPNSKVANIPIVTGAATTPGSFAGSPEVRLIPPNLNVFNINVKSSILTPSEAVDEVIKCNCDCWDNL